VDNPESLIVVFIIVFILDLLIAAAKESLLHTFLVRFFPQHEQMEPGFRQTLELFHSIPRLQTTLELTQSLTRFLAAGLAIYWSHLVFASSVFYLLGIAILMSLVLFWCEWIVEKSVSRDVDRWALRLTSFAKILMIIMTPLVGLPMWLAKMAHLLPEDERQVTEEELKTLVDAGQQGGILEQGERKMIYSIFEMGDTLAREVMVPRTDMLSLDVNTPLDQAIDALLAAGHSRVPVFEENVDHIIGLLYAKDLLRIWREGNHLESLRSLLRPTYFVPEAIKLDALLHEMQRKRIHMAIVVDEYGGISGLVTLEDIVEEVVGEIRDEYDQGEELPYQKIGEGEYLLQGRIDLDDFNELLGSQIPKDETDTLGGYIYKRLGRVPANGNNIQIGHVLLTVDEVVGRRIRKVRAKLTTNIQAEEEEKPHDNG
jgi:putative hemolysin